MCERESEVDEGGPGRLYRQYWDHLTVQGGWVWGLKGKVPSIPASHCLLLQRSLSAGDECAGYEDQAAEGYTVMCTKLAAQSDLRRGCCAKAPLLPSPSLPLSFSLI